MAQAKQGKVFLVSGASRGLAEGVALGLMQRGDRVHVLGRDRGRLEEWAARVGEECLHVGDVNEAGVAVRILENIHRIEGSLDGLVLGVGPYHAGSLANTDSAIWSELWRGNVQGHVALFDAARAALRASNGSALFFGAAGLAGLQARKSTAAYTAVKTALLSYMTSLAREEAEFGVRVNMVSPGIVPHGGASEDTRSSAILEQIPLGRAGEVQDIVSAALWLLGPQAGYVTGQNLEVAGGFLL